MKNKINQRTGEIRSHNHDNYQSNFAYRRGGKSNFYCKTHLNKRARGFRFPVCPICRQLMEDVGMKYRFSCYTRG